MSDSRTLSLGFVGGGVNSAVGYAHFVASRMDAYWSIDAGCFSRDAEINSESAVTYAVPAARTYPHWKNLLERERNDLDALVVLVPTPLHAEIVIAALDAGLPVICEKAMATSLDECRAIRDAVRRNSGFLAVTYNYSGFPMVRELRQMIKDGALGTIQQVHVEMPQEGFLRKSRPQTWRLTDYAVPTISLDLGVHLHHLVGFLTDAQPQEVVADQTTQGQFRGVVDDVVCLARYSGDLRVRAWFSKSALGYRNGLRLRVFGSLGSAEWYQGAPEELRLAAADGRRSVLERGAEDLRVANLPRYNRFKAGHPSGFLEAFANLYTDIAVCVRGFRDAGGSSSEYVFGTDHAEEGLRLLSAMASSARSGDRCRVTAPERLSSVESVPV